MDSYSFILGTASHLAEQASQVNLGPNEDRTLNIRPQFTTLEPWKLFNCQFPRLEAQSKFFWKTAQPRTLWRCHGSVECGEAEQPESEKIGMALILALVLGFYVHGPKLPA